MQKYDKIILFERRMLQKKKKQGEITVKITWLGQAGLLFENENIRIMVDPYLSDSCVKLNPKSHRRVPVDERFFDCVPDVMIFTHDHLDHYDPETVERFDLTKTALTVLAPASVWNRVIGYKGDNNYIRFDPHTTWTQNGVSFTAVKAAHSDPFAIGVLIDDGSKKYYVTGDTLYNSEIFADLPADIDTVFLPVNGVGNNMNMTDAAAFAKKVNAKHTVPLHIGLFDGLSADGFDCDNKTVPKFFEEIRL